MEIIRIPEERITELKKSRKDIEKKTKTKINISEGEITIEGDVSDTYFVKDIVKAIGRGFEPEKAMKIYTNDFQLHIINLKEYEKNENGIKRLKARVIGEKGKIKNEIENATDCYLSIYGNTIGIMAKVDTIEYTKEAIEIILGGSKFSTLFRYLSRIKKQIFKERLS